MNRLFSLPTHPLRLLLYLEWILLGLATLTTVVPHPGASWNDVSKVSVLSIVALALIGVRSPTKRLSAKVCYTALEFAIILVPLILEARSRFIPIHFLPLLGLVILIRACRMFKLPGRLLVAGAVFVSFLLSVSLLSPPFRVVRRFGPRPERYEPPTFEIPDFVGQPGSSPGQPDFMLLSLKLNAGITFALAIVFVLLLINALLTERQSRDKLVSAHEQLRQYALRIEDQATLQERNRIAREIHDALGHALTAQSIQLENALLFLPSNMEKTKKFITEARQLGTQALKEVRQSVKTLRSDPLQGKSLENAIAQLVNDFQTMTGIAPSYIVNLSYPATVEVGTALYRITQEALTNIYKHSEATKVKIHLYEQNEMLCLKIKDNGVGFHPEQNTTGFGLQSMQERTAALRGQFNLVSQPSTGCVITVQIPLVKVVA